MTRQELAQEIGNHVLDVFDKYMGNPVGKRVCIPVSLPREAYTKEIECIYPNFSNWTMTVECPLAPMVRVGHGPGDYEFLKPSEYFKLVGALGWE